MKRQSGFIGLVLLTVVIVGLVGVVVYVSYKGPAVLSKFLPSSLNSQKQPDKVAAKTAQDLKTAGETRFSGLKKTIGAAFPAGKYPNISSQIARAESAATLSDRYSILKTVFSDMNTIYGQTKDQRMIGAMIEVKQYVGAFPDYNVKDFILPK